MKISVFGSKPPAFEVTSRTSSTASASATLAPSTTASSSSSVVRRSFSKASNTLKRFASLPEGNAFTSLRAKKERDDDLSRESIPNEHEVFEHEKIPEIEQYAANTKAMLEQSSRAAADAFSLLDEKDRAKAQRFLDTLQSQNGQALTSIEEYHVFAYTHKIRMATKMNMADKVNLLDATAAGVHDLIKKQKQINTWNRLGVFVPGKEGDGDKQAFLKQGISRKITGMEKDIARHKADAGALPDKLEKLAGYLAAVKEDVFSCFKDRVEKEFLLFRMKHINKEAGKILETEYGSAIPDGPLYDFVAVCAPEAAQEKRQAALEKNGAAERRMSTGAGSIASWSSTASVATTLAVPPSPGILSPLEAGSGARHAAQSRDGSDPLSRFRALAIPEMDAFLAEVDAMIGNSSGSIAGKQAPPHAPAALESRISEKCGSFLDTYYAGGKSVTTDDAAYELVRKISPRAADDFLARLLGIRF